LGRVVTFWSRSCYHSFGGEGALSNRGSGQDGLHRPPGRRPDPSRLHEWDAIRKRQGGRQGPKQVGHIDVSGNWLIRSQFQRADPFVGRKRRRTRSHNTERRTLRSRCTTHRRTAAWRRFHLHRPRGRRPWTRRRRPPRRRSSPRRLPSPRPQRSKFARPSKIHTRPLPGNRGQ
jgi:hypothetical protein